MKIKTFFTMLAPAFFVATIPPALLLLGFLFFATPAVAADNRDIVLPESGILYPGVLT